MNLPKLTAGDPDKVYSFSKHLSWGVSDEGRFNELIAEAVKLVHPGSYFGDNLFTWCRNISFADDQPFVQALESNFKTRSDEATVWRRYVQACAAYHCVQLPGDFVECGCYFGTGVKTVMDYLGGKEFPKIFWAYDTFDYHPVAALACPDHQPGLFDEVRKRFDGYRQVRLAKGLIPGVFDVECPASISYLHIDLNHAESEIAALDRLFPLVVPGGVILLDDYEWSADYRRQKIAEDAWFEARSYRVMPLPTGQGLVIKR